MKDHDKRFDDIEMLKSLQEYIVHESNVSFGHNGTTRLYKFLKRE